jgi:hypothetical protein
VQHIWFFAYLLALAAAFALLEIQIEGDAGWAEKLPTWRVQNRLTRLLMGGRVLTGYHLWVHVSVFLLAHGAYALGLAAPSPRAEARILAFLVFFWIAEDFLWFVLNPAFGVRRFRREHVRWHAPAWWGIMPREYWLFLPLAGVLYVLSL